MPLHCLRVDLFEGKEVRSSHAFLGHSRDEVLKRYREHLYDSTLMMADLRVGNAKETWMCEDGNCNCHESPELEPSEEEYERTA